MDRKQRYRNQIKIRRQILIRAMGGECEECGAKTRLEFHHTEPRTWVASSHAQEERQCRYEREYMEGKLSLLCKSCNQRAGVPEPDDTPF